MLVGALLGGGACEDQKPPPTPLVLGGLSFPQLRGPLSEASPQMQALARKFEQVLVAAELPALGKDDFLDITEEEIVARKKQWIDAQIVERHGRLRQLVAEMKRIAATVPRSKPVEWVAARALAGCAMRMYYANWQSLDTGSGEFLVGPRVGIPPHFTAEQRQELEVKEFRSQPEVDAYFRERSAELKAPERQAGLDELKRCASATAGSKDPPMGQWHAFCAKWMD